jgi:hypothetical protein
VPDITTPAMLAYSGGTLRQWRVVPARLTYAAGNVTSSKDTATAGLAAVPNLAVQQRQVAIGEVSINGKTYSVYVTAQEQLRQQNYRNAIVGAFGATNLRVNDIEAIVARLSAAEQLAQAANDTAIAAVAQVEGVATAVAETFTEIDPVYGDGFNGRYEP